MKTRYNPAEPTKISAFNRRANALAIAFFTVVIVLAFLPVLLVIMSALSSEESVSLYGYRFIPREFSLEAFRVMSRSGSTLPRAFLNSVLITLGGTALGLAIMCPCAYALSRGEFRHRKGLMLFLMIPMLFSGGLVATYMVNTQVLRLRNTYLALILPGMCTTWYIMLLRNYFVTTVPDALIESARLDGAQPFQTFLRVALPICTPVVMTVAIFQLFAYWNSHQPHGALSAAIRAGEHRAHHPGHEPGRGLCLRREQLRSALRHAAHGDGGGGAAADHDTVSLLPEIFEDGADRGRGEGVI